MATKTEQGYNIAKEKLDKAEAVLREIRNRPRSLFSLFKPNAEGAKALSEYQKAQRELAQWTKSGALAKGMLSAGVDVVTGVPDVLAMVANFGMRKAMDDAPQIPILGDIVKGAAGLNTPANTTELQNVQDVPGYVATAIGIKQLASAGFKGLRALRNSKKAKKFLAGLTTPESNAFKKYMVNGQGSNSTEVQATINKLQSTPEYAELFQALEEGARAELNVANVLPDVAEKGSETVSKVAGALSDRINKMKSYRSSSSGVKFEAAKKLSGNSPIVPVINVKNKISELRGRYNTNTKDGNAVVAYLDDLEQSLMPRLQLPDGSVVVLTQAAPKLTVAELQRKMAEMGKKVGMNDGVAQAVASDTKQVINDSLFASFADDLTEATKNATGSNKESLQNLQEARLLYKKGSDAISEAVSKGVPAFLKNKKPNEITYEELASVYKGQNAEQNKTLRTWLTEEAPDSVAKLDKFVFDDFISSTQKRLPNGEVNYDLGALAEKWAKLSKDEADTLAVTMGQSFSEFNTKMKDALVFSKKVNTGSEAAEGVNAIDRLTNPVSAVVGSTPVGYQGAKATQVAMNTASALFAQKGMSEKQLMKMLLTKEGADFLGNAKLSPQGQRTLESLVNLNKADIPSTVSWAAFVGDTATGGNADQQVMPEPTAQINLPDSLDSFMMQETAEPSGDIMLPDSLDDFMIPQEPLMQQEPANAPEALIPQQTSSGKDNPMVLAQLQKMKQVDPNLNVDYVYKSFMRAPPQQQQQLLSQLGM